MSYRIPPSMDDADTCLPLEVKRWYIAYTKVRRERHALIGLQEDGLRAYLPQMTDWIMHARKKSKVERPLFPRYLFVELSADSPEFYKVRANRDIECLVGTCGSPAAIRPETVGDIRSAEAAGEFDLTNGEDPNDPYKAGDSVMVRIGGKFAGWPGRVVRMTDAQRVEVLIRGIGGKEHTKTFGPDELEAAA